MLITVLPCTNSRRQMLHLTDEALKVERLGEDDGKRAIGTGGAIDAQNLISAPNLVLKDRTKAFTEVSWFIHHDFFK
jgi:hypothetical protein